MKKAIFLSLILAMSFSFSAFTDETGETNEKAGNGQGLDLSKITKALNGLDKSQIPADIAAKIPQPIINAAQNLITTAKNPDFISDASNNKINPKLVTSVKEFMKTCLKDKTVNEYIKNHKAEIPAEFSKIKRLLLSKWIPSKIKDKKIADELRKFLSSSNGQIDNIMSAVNKALNGASGEGSAVYNGNEKDESESTAVGSNGNSEGEGDVGGPAI